MWVQIPSGEAHFFFEKKRVGGGVLCCCALFDASQLHKHVLVLCTVL